MADEKPVSSISVPVEFEPLTQPADEQLPLPAPAAPGEEPEAIPDDERSVRRGVYPPARCAICDRLYLPGWNLQRYCWTCKKQIKEGGNFTEADKKRADSYKHFLTRLKRAGIEGMEPAHLLDTPQDYPCGFYGVVKCTPRERIVAQLLAINEDVAYIFGITGVPIWKIFKYQSNEVESCPKFTSLLHYHHDKAQFLVLGNVIRTLNEGLQAAPDLDIVERVRANTEIAKLAERQADLGNRLTATVKDRQFVIEDMAPPDVKKAAEVLLARVLRYQKGGGPKL